MDHPGVALFSKFVTLIARGEASTDQRKAAVALAMHLFQLDEISKGKCVEVARDAGPTEPAFDDAVRTLHDDLSGDVPPEWAQSPVPLLLSEERLAESALLIQEPRGRPSSELSPEARASKMPRPPHERMSSWTR
jgi:hypothetical protein